MRYVETTHRVTNQPPPLSDYDAFLRDEPLRENVAKLAAPALLDRFAAYGRVVGSAEFIEHGFLANRFAPELRTHDRFGHRVDEVLYHPSYHAIMRAACEHAVHSVAWT